MAARDITQGRRVDFTPGWPGENALPGDYCDVPDGVHLGEFGVWYAVDPTGCAGAIIRANHTTSEHDDGSITCTPSLVTPSGWHGVLERGVWREV